jgi:predicted RNA-binding protein associated with RNAse of E/G family
VGSCSRAACSPTITTWPRSCKDEDELAFAVNEGRLTPVDAVAIRATAESAIDDVTTGRWPFAEDVWNAFRPVGTDDPLHLPPGWTAP